MLSRKQVHLIIMYVLKKETWFLIYLLQVGFSFTLAFLSHSENHDLQLLLFWIADNQSIKIFCLVLFIYYKMQTLALVLSYLRWTLVDGDWSRVRFKILSAVGQVRSTANPLYKSQQNYQEFITCFLTNAFLKLISDKVLKFKMFLHSFSLKS